MRYFNTAGPVNPQQHYCLPPLQRAGLEDVTMLVQQGKYFVLHAPRQTGKTTSLLALKDSLNAQGDYLCVYCNVEVGQAARENVTAAMQAILSELGARVRLYLNDDFVDRLWPEVLARSGAYGALNAVLTQWAAHSPKPLLLLIDEIDSLVGDTLIAVLRQLRAGYDKRPRDFPHSVILCGVRDVRDYRIQSITDQAIVTGGSAFNVKAESLNLGNFSRTEMELLYRQHSDDTGQAFMPEALDRVWELSDGQPWVISALGYETCFRMASGRDRSQAITAAIIEQAKENLILRRETHLDQLADKLKEARVRRVIEPLLAGRELAEGFKPDDVDYLVDLGLIKRERNGAIQLANAMYQEVIPRELIWTTQQGIAQQPVWYIDADSRRLDMTKLLAAFQAFFREHSEHWIERFAYKEAGPQLLLQAFLQRIVNSDGRIEREYGLGRMRTDLLVLWPAANLRQRIVIELKLLHRNLEHTLAQGVQQTWQYMDRCGADEGHLLIFDRDAAKTWEEKLFRREQVVQGKTIVVWGM